MMTNSSAFVILKVPAQWPRDAQYLASYSKEVHIIEYIYLDSSRMNIYATSLSPRSAAEHLASRSATKNLVQYRFPLLFSHIIRVVEDTHECQLNNDQLKRPALQLLNGAIIPGAERGAHSCNASNCRRRNLDSVAHRNGDRRPLKSESRSELSHLEAWETATLIRSPPRYRLRPAIRRHAQPVLLLRTRPAIRRHAQPVLLLRTRPVIRRHAQPVLLHHAQPVLLLVPLARLATQPVILLVPLARRTVRRSRRLRR
jgi:hypothetical protein